MAVNNAASAKYLGGMNQETTRSTAVWFDQHRNMQFRDANGDYIFEMGRPYYSIIEIASRMPVGPVMPLGWEAPVYAPQKYLLSSIGRITNLPKAQGEGLAKLATTDRFKLDYEAMERDDREATDAHWRLAVQVAADRDWPAPRWGAPMDRRLLAIIGPAPRSPKIAQAFKAENPWALGMLMPVFNPATGRTEVEVDEQLARILTLNRDDLVTAEEAERLYAEDEARAATAKEMAHPDVLAEVKAQLAEIKEMKRDLAAQLAAAKGTPKRGPGRPPRTKSAPLAPVEG